MRVVGDDSGGRSALVGLAGRRLAMQSNVDRACPWCGGRRVGVREVDWSASWVQAYCVFCESCGPSVHADKPDSPQSSMDAALIAWEESCRPTE